ncbi:MAG TPA: alpha/beta hydrolase [Acidimicrobiia bacterium]|nr:alpha/beta hydrolase [Acidimicrobiia bacterium]
MDVILIPGLWLDASSWDEVVPLLERAGHSPHPVTLPGMEARDADRSGVTRSDCVDAIVSAIDQSEGPVVVVGHSMGAGLAHAAVDSRPDRVARAIYIGGFPDADGSASEFPSENGEIPLFDWSDFDEAELRDLDETALAEFRERAIPSPERMVSDPQRLSDERRYHVPATVICPEFSADMLQKWIDDDLEPVRELKEIRDVTYVDLPTGHWPQFTKPEQLAQAIVDAIESHSGG